MVDLKEQYVCIRFCFKLGESAVEASEICKAAFGQQTVRRREVLGGGGVVDFQGQRQCDCC
jgi:hypothetical protein